MDRKLTIAIDAQSAMRIVEQAVQQIDNAAERLIGEIALERVRQDEQWGGPDHDDQHTFHDWANYIYYQLRTTNGIAPPADVQRERFIKVAALAVAAIESLDRANAGTTHAEHIDDASPES